MKTYYTELDMEIIYFENGDICTTTSGGEGDDPEVPIDD